MKIEVLGSGCPRCKRLYESTLQATRELGLDAVVTYETDVRKLVELGVMSSPVLAIDGTPVLVGSVPSVEKIKELLS